MAIPLPHRLHRIYCACVANAVAAHHAHALRNTLGGVSSSVFFVRRRLESEGLLQTDDRIAKSLDVVEARLRDAAGLADARVPVPAAPATELVLSDAVAELLASVSPPAGTRLLGPEARPFRAFVSRDVLELALRCLLDNAIESVEAKGGGTVRVGLEDSAAGWVVELRDDGGIEPGVLERAEEPFFSTKAGHLGMGLPVVQRLVALFGGRFDLGGAPPGGVRAAFTIAKSQRG